MALAHPVRCGAGAAAIFLTVLTLGCSNGSKITAPPVQVAGSEVPCAGGTVQLSVLQATTVDCSSGNVVTLAGNGASYLVVPEFAATDVPLMSTPFAIGYSNALTASRPATRVASLSDLAGPVLARRPSPGRRQAIFDLGLRHRERTMLATGRWRFPPSVRAALRPRSETVAPPPLNSERAFDVLSSSDPNNPVFKSVTARLEYVGTNLLVYVDTMAPVSVAQSDLDRVGQVFDGTLYPLDVSTFGPPTDIDNNGRVIMLMSPTVNALTTASSCSTQGYVAGFFDGTDLADTASTNSNRGEVFYTIVPDPSGTLSCAHTVSNFLDEVPSVFLHEVQHLINFSQKVVLRGGQPEEGWLDEGLSRIAEELGSIHYEALYPPPSGRTNPAQLFPDSAEAYIVGVIYDSYQFLLNPAAETVTLHDDSDDGLAWRGGDWLLLRWLGDQFGTDLYQRLEQTSLTGSANISSATGEAFPNLFGDFSLALVADSIPGQARSATPPRDRFISRNLRQLYQAIYNVSGPSSDIPLPFPITTFSLGTGVVAADSMPAGSLDFATLVTPTDSAVVHVRFATPAGGLLPAVLVPQVGVLRLPG